jgi:hypothetical protein
VARDRAQQDAELLQHLEHPCVVGHAVSRPGRTVVQDP